MAEIRTYENDRLCVKISDHGAELSGIYDKKNNREVIWDANPDVWNRHAPVLFPSVGVTHNGEYRYNGKTYKMGQHGFARDMDFTFVGIEGNQIIHELKSTEETKENYPFDFVFRVIHVVEENKVIVKWQVENKTAGDMYFTIGAHPAFNVPAKEGTERKDYKLTFEGQDKLDYILINSTEGTAIYKDVKELPLTNGKYTIGEHLFDDGVLIFEDTQVEKVGLEFPDGTPYVTIDCKGFPFTGVWTKPVAPFVCLEPWYGRCDNEDFTGEYQEKTGVQKLDEGKTFDVQYTITIH